MSDEQRATKYTQAEIDALGAKGHAFKNPDGHYSYPIDDAEDLADAIQAVGRSGAEHDSVRKYIMGRAAALGLSDQIPADWDSDGSIDETAPEAKSQVTVVDEPPPAAIRGELRNVPEHRVSVRQEFELREVPNGTGGTNLKFTGFACVTEVEYEMEDWLGPWVESVSKGAFTKTLNEGADVAFLVNHEGLTLARTKPGTLKLSEITDPAASPSWGVIGLYSEALLDPQNFYVQAMRSAVERSDLDEMSFAFRVMRQEWNDKWNRRWINEVSLDKGDVSLVNYGANPHTGGTVSLRQRRTVRVPNPREALAFVADAVAELRAGKTISAATANQLAGTYTHLDTMGDAADGIRGIVDDLISMSSSSGDNDDGEPVGLSSPVGLFREIDFRRDRARIEALRHPPGRAA